jgi:hypothetical protein
MLRGMITLPEFARRHSGDFGSSLVRRAMRLELFMAYPQRHSSEAENFLFTLAAALE